MVPALAASVEEKISIDDRPPAEPVVDIDSRARHVVEEVPRHLREARLRLAPRARLTLVHADLANDISMDLCEPRLLPASSVYTGPNRQPTPRSHSPLLLVHAIFTLFSVLSVRPDVLRVSPRGHRIVADVGKRRIGHRDIASIPTEEKRITVQQCELACVHGYALRAFHEDGPAPV